MPDTVDVLIVGSGPVGSAYARLLAESRSDITITMVELGPQLTDTPGVNVRNLPPDERLRAQLASQGPDAGGALSSIPGLHLVGAAAMPAAAMASCVGGMGAHWAGATPQPWQTECVPFIANEDWQASVETAERLLATRHDLFADSEGGHAIRHVLTELFEPILPSERRVGIPPLALQPTREGHVHISGVRHMLAPIDGLLSGRGRFELRPNTLCRTLLMSNDRIAGVVVEDRRTGSTETLTARVVVVAADSFRTPQLLWASGIRPEALGRHLMEHPHSVAEVALNPDLAPPVTPEDEKRLLLSASCVPFADPQHPYQGSVSHMPLAMSGARVSSGAGSVVLCWWGRTWPRPENRVLFSDTETDWCGMPALSIEFAMSPAEKDELERGSGLVNMAARALGPYLPGMEPHTSPLGSSLHYQGTVRMGEHEDGGSVCDAWSRVWGIGNLFVGGNGVIPTATTCNPTLMSVALAARSVEEVLRTLE